MVEAEIRQTIKQQGACKAKMNLREKNSKQFWIGKISQQLVDVLITGWDNENWIIEYDGNTYKLPFYHFIEIEKATTLN